MFVLVLVGIKSKPLWNSWRTQKAATNLDTLSMILAVAELKLDDARYNPTKSDATSITVVCTVLFQNYSLL